MSAGYDRAFEEAEKARGIVRDEHLEAWRRADHLANSLLPRIAKVNYSDLSLDLSDFGRLPEAKQKLILKSVRQILDSPES